jgi:hypothetical protein
VQVTGEGRDRARCRARSVAADGRRAHPAHRRGHFTLRAGRRETSVLPCIEHCVENLHRCIFGRK